MRAWTLFWNLSPFSKGVVVVIATLAVRAVFQLVHLIRLAAEDADSPLRRYVSVTVTRVGDVSVTRIGREREEETMPRGGFVCVHCGQPSGVTGHVRTGTRQRPVCPSTEPMTIVRDHRGREFGFCCPPGHACMFGSSAHVERRRRGAWRTDLMTAAQWDYMLALGYKGERPVNKGQAHDLLEQLLAGAFEPAPGAVRGITVRGDPPDGPAVAALPERRPDTHTR